MFQSGISLFKILDLSLVANYSEKFSITYFLSAEPIIMPINSVIQKGNHWICEIILCITLILCCAPRIAETGIELSFNM